MSDDPSNGDTNTDDAVASDDDVAGPDNTASDSDEVADAASDHTRQPPSRSSRFREFANQLDNRSDTGDPPEPSSTQTPVDSDTPAAELERHQSAEDVNSWEWLEGTEESTRNEGDETKHEETEGPSRDDDTESETGSTDDSDGARTRIWSSTDTDHAKTDEHEQDAHPERETADSHESSDQPANNSPDDPPSGSTGGPGGSPSESYTPKSTADDTPDGVTDFMRGGSATDTGFDDVAEQTESPLDPTSTGSPESLSSSEEVTSDTTDTTATNNPTSTVTDASVPSPEEPPSAEEQPKKRRIWSDDGDSSATTTASADGESTPSTNRTGAGSHTSEHLSETSSISESETPSAVDPGFDPDETTKYHRPDGFSPDLGTSTMIQCGAQDEEKHAACLDLIGVTTDVTPRNVLLVQYREIDQEDLIQISGWASQVKVIAIGYSQPIPGALDDTVEVIKINNPNAITRLGIVISGTVDNWQSTEYKTVVCYGSLNVLLEYTNTQRTFRFLHILLGTLRKRKTISHFHVDPMAADVQQVNTLKPLFDSILSIDSMGTHLE